MTTDFPNIVLIMTDNQPADAVGCYGNNEIHTPNLDALAADGVRFNNAYCPNAMCSPSRASVWSGRMPCQHGVHTWLNDKLMDQWPEDWNAIAEFDTLPEILNRNGYATAMIGKYHLGKLDKPQNGIDHWITMSRGHTLDFYGNEMIVNGDTFIHDGHSVDFFSEKAVDYIDGRTNSPDQPFLLMLPYNGPYGHWPSIKGRAKNVFADLYDNCELNSVPREGINKRVIDRYSSRVLDSGGNLPEQFSGPLLLPNNKDSLRNYFSQTSLIDDGVGKIINELKNLKLFDNTIIIYTSDHGFSLGNHGIWGHGMAAWPSSIHRPSFNIPLIFSGPGVKEGKSNALVSQLDLANTILSLTKSSKLEGERVDSLSLVLSNESHKNRDKVFMEQEESRAVRTKKWLFINRFNREGMDWLSSELYDLEKDPDERNNLSDEKKFIQIIQMLNKDLIEYFEKHSDPSYDLWRGGSAKSNVSNPKFWKEAWGPDWKTTF